MRKQFQDGVREFQDALNLIQLILNEGHQMCFVSREIMIFPKRNLSHIKKSLLLLTLEWKKLFDNQNKQLLEKKVQELEEWIIQLKME